MVEVEEKIKSVLSCSIAVKESKVSYFCSECKKYHRSYGKTWQKHLPYIDDNKFPKNVTLYYIDKNGIERYISNGEKRKAHTLLKYITPLVEKFSVKPEKNKRYFFGNFNRENIYYYGYNGEMCFTLKEFAKYIKYSHESVGSRVSEKTKNLFLIEGKHYFKINRDYFSSTYGKRKLKTESQRGFKAGKPIIFLTFLGVMKLLRTFKKEITTQFYDWFCERIYFKIKTDQFDLGEFLLTNPATDKTKDAIKKIIEKISFDFEVSKEVIQNKIKQEYNFKDLNEITDRIGKDILEYLNSEVFISFISNMGINLNNPTYSNFT